MKFKDNNTDFKGIKKVYTCAFCSKKIYTQFEDDIKIITEFLTIHDKKVKCTTVICELCKHKYSGE